MPHRILQNTNFRLAMLYAAIFALSVLLLGTLMYISIRHSLEAQMRSHILADTEQLMGDYHDDGLEELRHDIRERTDNNRAHRLFYALKSSSGKVLFDDIARSGKDGWQTVTTARGDKVLVFTTLLDDGYSLHVGTDLDDIAALERALRNSIAAVLLLVLLLSITGGIIISRRFLARVDRLTRATESIGRGSLSARLPVSPAQDDFDQLAVTINHMLERIELLMEEVKNVSTGIAHDMRTPLGKLRQKLETLSTMPQNSETAQQLNESITLLDETLITFSSLLRIAELESGNISAQRTSIDIDTIFAQLAETYSIVAEENGQHFSASSTAASLHADKALLMQLLVNLIENAIHHSGRNTRITLSARTEEQATVITIADNGQGIPASEHAQILKPFYRLDRSRNTRGTGLGLSLVNAIATLHGATLSVRDNHPGLAVDIRFPVSV